MHFNASAVPAKKRVALVQSVYIPWKGFFDLIGRCDQYIIYDSAAFSKNHWHNRNRIKTPQGTSWLTIPVLTAGKLGQPIEEVDVKPGWADAHWSRLAQAYRAAPFFGQLAPAIRGVYEAAAKETNLSRINELFLRTLASMLRLDVEIVRDTAYESVGKRTDKVVSICRSADATHYLSGPSAAAYLEPAKFEEAGIILEWMAYGPYPAYPQLHGPFEHGVTILDVLFSLGPDGWRRSLQLETENTAG
jgi:hypothetical protein